MKYFSPENSENPNGKWLRSTIKSKFSNEPFFKSLTKKDLESRSSNYSIDQRQILVNVLKDQYQEWKDDDSVISLIEKLRIENAVTVTSGHQLSLCLGPLYVHSKIRETQYLSNFLSEKYDQPVVPVFWMATEDHDFEEIRHLRFQEQDFSMGEEIKGHSVGSLPCSIAQEVVEKMISQLGGNTSIKELLICMHKAYSLGGTLADATRRLIHEFHPGILCLDASDQRLKAMACGLWEDEILNQTLYNSREISIWNNEREEPVPFRPSMMFYLKNGIRSRIDFENGEYFSDGHRWTPNELLNEASSHPERISPNALLRPIYQETILPNVSYLGGLGEIEYWLQLIPYLKQWKKSNVRINIRTSFAWWTRATQRNWSSISENGINYWTSEKEYRSHWLKILGKSDVDRYPVLETVKRVMNSHYNQNNGVEQSTDAWLQRIKRDEKRMNERIRRGSLKKVDIQMKRYKSFKNEHHPGNALQERKWTLIDLVFHFGLNSSSKYTEGLGNENNGLIWILQD